MNLVVFKQSEAQLTTGELVLFATLGPQKCGKKSQHVAKKANTWQKKPMPGKQKSRVKKDADFDWNR